MSDKELSAFAKVQRSLYKGAAIQAHIDRFAKSGQKLQAEAAKLALSVLVHVGTHRDTRMVQQFMLVMPDMVRTNGLRKWFEAFGPVKFVAGEDGAERVIFVKDKDVKLADAIEKPFWKFSATEGEPYKPLDMDKFLNQIITRLVKDAKETGRSHSQLILALKGVGKLETAQAAELGTSTVDPLAGDGAVQAQNA